jgi:hypothetical protein
MRPHHREFKIKGSFGVYDVFKKIRRDGWYNIERPVKEKEFYAIIRGVNNLLAENIANGIDVVFPHKMGKLELRKFKCGAFMSDNKLQITYPINWSETLKLWYQDVEARKAKTLLYAEQPYIYRVAYNKSNANYNNLCFYNFAVNRFIKLALKENIKAKKIDALW